MSSQIPRVVVLVVAVILSLLVAAAAADAAVVPTITAIATGYDHTCALTSDAVVKCWGHNGYGQLGNGSMTDSSAPIDVAGLTSGVSSISDGFFDGCAVMSGDEVKCWGWNENGQLGNGSTTNSSVPVEVARLTSRIRAIAVGARHTCALTSGGGVKCWGSNDDGQLGNGSTTDSDTPVDVSGLTGGVAAISAGALRTCAISGGGGVKCWGYPNGGVPVDVAGLTSGISAIAAGGDHTCVLTSGGGVKCWGSNQWGQLGDGSTKGSLTPVDVAGLTIGVKAISAGPDHTCALTTGGGVKCWGYNGSGRLGNAISVGFTGTPADVAGLSSGIVAISAGFRHTCALTSAGAVKCWGYNAYGQLGNGRTTNSSVPVGVDFSSHMTIALRASKPAGTIAPGTLVTFSASVRPLGPAVARAIVRFEIYRQESGVWRLAARRDVAVDAIGRATLRWTFATTGSRYVRARALANATYAGSRWSPLVRYTVG